MDGLDECMSGWIDRWMDVSVTDEQPSVVCTGHLAFSNDANFSSLWAISVEKTLL